ncbi:MAG: hypothetical protein IPP69_10635 [Flavobacteriales bacterium]|nr:hypothetical protein [Flavobacteriales bacterium]
MKDQTLWEKIDQCEFDQPRAEYSFSVRLASENYWTDDFTKKAILEYKKFMYLAAVYDAMVSPSAIVDVVWHQHLIFTQSYQEFCSLLGKQIQHIPSTHNKEDAEKFIRAKERTKKFYLDEFGAQPSAIWEYEDMYASLQLPKAKYKLRSFVIVGLLAVILLAVPFYFLLRPIYMQLGNPGFVWVYFVGGIFIFLLMEWFNKGHLRKLTQAFPKDSFIHHLHPYELIYLKNQNLENIVHAATNEAVLVGAIGFQNKQSFELKHPEYAKSPIQWQVSRICEEQKSKFYHETFHRLLRKPMIRNFGSSMNALMKYFNKSKAFHRLFGLNFLILACWFLLGFTRIMTGMMRDKPVFIITVICILFGIFSIIYLYSLTKKFGKSTLPEIYKHKILTKSTGDEAWKWQYCYGRQEALNMLFLPAVLYVVKSQRSDSDSSSTSSCGTSDSSCGSSCSSCGGCGGGD